MQYDWVKTAWKGVWAAISVALAAALYAGGEVFLSYFDTPEELAAAGTPVVFIPVLVALITMIKDYFKHRNLGKK